MILNQNMVLFFQSSQLLILIRKRYSKIAIAWPIKTCINVSNTHLRSTSSTAEARLFPALFSYMMNHIVWSVGMEGFYILFKPEIERKYNLCLFLWYETYLFLQIWRQVQMYSNALKTSNYPFHFSSTQRNLSNHLIKEPCFASNHYLLTNFDTPIEGLGGAVYRRQFTKFVASKLMSKKTL